MDYKKILLVAALCAGLTFPLQAEESATDNGDATVQFAYDAGAEVVSAYLWRGQRLAGLSVQPNLQIGYDGQYTSLRFGGWWSMGASDWYFNKETMFYPEMDLSLDFSFFGVNLGVTHLYYFDLYRDKGDCAPFFGWKPIEQVYEDGYTSQTEVKIGYDFGELLNFPLSITWYTNVAGADYNEDEVDGSDEVTVTRAYSSYLEIAYEHELPFGMRIGAELGMSPWRSDYSYANTKFAVVNIAARLDKEWELDVCTLDLFVQGSINPDGLTKDNAIVTKNTEGWEKTSQKINGLIGFGVWF